MKIVVMSDTHLNQVTVGFKELCARYCDGADKVIHLGDMTVGPILDFLEQYPLEAVSGNMDDPVIQDRLPVKKVIAIAGYRFGLIHGWGSGLDMTRRLTHEFSNVDAILFGHTHRPLQLTEAGIFWFNPGSVTSGRGAFPRSIGILNVKDRIESEIIPL